MTDTATNTGTIARPTAPPPDPTAGSAAKPGAAKRDPIASLWRHQITGLAATLLFLVGGGGWAATTEISGAVIAPGSVVVEGSSKRVQHLEGGIVAAIAVKNSDHVHAGQELIRLDGTDIRASLQITRGQIEELKARQARLLAERDGADGFEMPPADPALDIAGTRTAVWQGQIKLFASRRSARLDKEQQQLERIGQLEQAIHGLTAQLNAKDQTLVYLNGELEDLVQLHEQQLIARPRLLAQQREKSKIEGERGQFLADIARTKVQISETRLQSAESKQTLMSDVLGELREVETKLAELTERESATAAKLKRLTVLAPLSGVVHKLNVFTIGGVVGPGETIMEVVPNEASLAIEGQLDPAAIDQVNQTFPVRIRLPALDQRVTPELDGHIVSISADVRQDSPQLPRYYAIRAVIEPGEMPKLGTSRLVPGMPAEVMIVRGDRTVLSFLLKPLVDQFAHVFRER